MATPPGCNGLDLRSNTLESNWPDPRSANGKRAGDPERGTAAGEGEASKGQGVGEEGTWSGTRKGSWQAAQNPANPRIGSGVQQTRKTACGANHQGGEKPRRWNRTYRLATVGRSALSDVANPHGRSAQEWTQAAHVDGEAIFEQPHERSPVKTGPEGSEGAFERQPEPSRERNSKGNRTQDHERTRMHFKPRCCRAPGKANDPELEIPMHGFGQGVEDTRLALSPNLSAML